MKVIHTAKELAAGTRKVCLTLGFFDGVHLGHQQLVHQTIADAQRLDAISLVVTFDQHPNVIVAPDHVPLRLYSLSQKIRTLDSLGAEAMLLLPFDRAFSEQSGETFIRSLARDLGRIQSICVGADFVFGHKRSGNVALLNRLGAELGFVVHGISAVALDGQVVSSTRIREKVRTGDFDSASQMLGRAYSVAGVVVKGDGRGRELGFPTANLEVTGLVLPPNGVYCAQASVAGQMHHAVLNLGHRPTVQEPVPQVHFEVHLLDFDRELYGEEIEVRCGKKLRDEKKFPSIEALREQIVRDVTEARAHF